MELLVSGSAAYLKELSQKQHSKRSVDFVIHFVTTLLSIHLYFQTQGRTETTLLKDPSHLVAAGCEPMTSEDKLPTVSTNTNCHGKQTQKNHT